jgi:hypothetical protein
MVMKLGHGSKAGVYRLSGVLGLLLQENVAANARGLFVAVDVP